MWCVCLAQISDNEHKRVVSSTKCYRSSKSVSDLADEQEDQRPDARSGEDRSIMNVIKADDAVT